MKLIQGLGEMCECVLGGQRGLILKSKPTVPKPALMTSGGLGEMFGIIYASTQ